MAGLKMSAQLLHGQLLPMLLAIDLQLHELSLAETPSWSSLRVTLCAGGPVPETISTELLFAVLANQLLHGVHEMRVLGH